MATVFMASQVGTGAASGVKKCKYPPNPTSCASRGGEETRSRGRGVSGSAPGFNRIDHHLRGRLGLTVDRVEHFLAVDRHIARGFNAQPYLVAADFHHRNRDR